MRMWWVVVPVVMWSVMGQPARADESARELTLPERQQLEKEGQLLAAKMQKLYAEGKLVEASEYARKCLVLFQNLYPAAKFPSGHPDLARILNNLGVLLRAQGRYAQALPYVEQALAMRQKLYPAAKFPQRPPRPG
jgi:tetratricopeptide (TPR) repeat protein